MYQNLVRFLFHSEQNVKSLSYNAECGPSVDLLILQHKVIEIVCPKKIIGWTVTDKQLSVSDQLRYCTL